MGNENILNPKKPRYDIFMSRRTRKPSNLKPEPDQESKSEEQKQEEYEEKPSLVINKEKKISYDHKQQQQKSLKELIDESRCSLGQHFWIEEENERRDQMVVWQNRQEVRDAKLNKIAGLHNKVLGHLIKVKLEYSDIKLLRKPAMLLKYFKD